MMPRPKKMTPKTVKVTIVEPNEGTGLQAGKVYCLNLEFFSFSTFSRMRSFSSSVISILVSYALLDYNLFNY